MTCQAHAVTTAVLAIAALKTLANTAVHSRKTGVALAANLSTISEAIAMTGAVIKARPVKARWASEPKVALASHSVRVARAMTAALIGTSLHVTFGALEAQSTVTSAIDTLTVLARRRARDLLTSISMPAVVTLALVIVAAAMTGAHALVRGGTNEHRAVQATVAL